MSPLRRLLARSAAAVAASDEDEAAADESYEDDLDLDEPMAAGKLFHVLTISPYLVLATILEFKALPCLVQIDFKPPMTPIPSAVMYSGTAAC